MSFIKITIDKEELARNKKAFNIITSIAFLTTKAIAKNIVTNTATISKNAIDLAKSEISEIK